MSKKKNDKQEEQKRQSVPWFDKPEGFDSWAPDKQFEYRMQCLAQMRNSPFHKAKEKLNAFIGGCVADPDFRHPDSAALLDLLLIVRDNLLSDETTTATKEWTLDDMLLPVLHANIKAISKRTRKSKQKKAAEEIGYNEESEIEKAIRGWLERGNPRLRRDKYAIQVADRLMAEYGIKKSDGRIYKDWLGKKAIAAYLEKHKVSG